MQRILSKLPLALLFLPIPVFASTTTDVLSQLAGLFYIIVGLTLVVSLLLMFGGIILWIVRLGTSNTYRDEAIHIMEWGIATLFTLILVLWVVEFIQTHTSAALYILSLIIILVIAWLVITSGVFTGGEEKKEEH